ncbi:unnamed protein product [Owenia fusiformis]|uniref:Connexin cysteine-rich domain-containing protein n=1 Tax=Owenia fusiformis TaxID=6347 RepID=A0A8S4PV14_OWEFU|nr:unnamed protein product [Owenia fusiformis]
MEGCSTITEKLEPKYFTVFGFLLNILLIPRFVITAVSQTELFNTDNFVCTPNVTLDLDSESIKQRCHDTFAATSTWPPHANWYTQLGATISLVFFFFYFPSWWTVNHTEQLSEGETKTIARGYLAQTAFRTIIEFGFGVTQVALYGFQIPSQFVCSVNNESIPCDVLKVTGKTAILVAMLIISLAVVILHGVDSMKAIIMFRRGNSHRLLPVLLDHGSILPQEVDQDQSGTADRGPVDQEITETIKSVQQKIGLVYATNFFYAYLKIVIQRGTCPGSKLKDTIQEYIDKKDLKRRKIRMAKKLYILVPDSGKCPNLMSEKDPKMKKTYFFEFKANRAGSSRTFTNTVWKFKIGDQDYHVLAEFATILQTLTELPEQIINDKEKRIETRKFYKELKRNIDNTFGEYGDVVELVDIDDSSPTISEVLKEKIDKDFKEADHSTVNPVKLANINVKLKSH